MIISTLNDLIRGVKLFFDENLSPRFVEHLATVFPGSAQPESLGMRGRTDAQTWDYARDSGFMIVSKDNDFPSGRFYMVHHRKSSGFQRGMLTRSLPRNSCVQSKSVSRVLSKLQKRGAWCLNFDCSGHKEM